MFNRWAIRVMNSVNIGVLATAPDNTQKSHETRGCVPTERRKLALSDHIKPQCSVVLAHAFVVQNLPLGTA